LGGCSEVESPGQVLVHQPGGVLVAAPWPIDDFHGRMYTAAFLTLAAGAAVSRARATVAEIRAIGATALAFGGLSSAGLVFTDAAEDRVDWGAAGTTSWLVAMELIALVGLALLVRPASR
jgi:hypothetical protein